MKQEILKALKKHKIISYQETEEAREDTEQGFVRKMSREEVARVLAEELNKTSS